MSKKPFVNPSIKLKATIKELQKEIRYLKNQNLKLVKRNELRSNLYASHWKY